MKFRDLTTRIQYFIYFNLQSRIKEYHYIIIYYIYYYEKVSRMRLSYCEMPLQFCKFHFQEQEVLDSSSIQP